jgi:hypothetical protein
MTNELMAALASVAQLLVGALSARESWYRRVPSVPVQRAADWRSGLPARRRKNAERLGTYLVPTLDLQSTDLSSKAPFAAISTECAAWDSNPGRRIKRSRIPGRFTCFYRLSGVLNCSQITSDSLNSVPRSGPCLLLPEHGEWRHG